MLDAAFEESEPSHRARWLGVVLILAALAVLTWQALLAGEADEWPAEPVVVAPPQPSLIARLASVDVARPGPQVASAAARAVPSAPAASAAGHEVEVCDLGRVPADEAGEPKDMAPIRLAARRARERLLALLLAGTDESTRAAGLLMQSLSPVNGDDAAQAAQANARARDALANLAVATRTPQVYAWAMQACNARPGEGACRLLSSDQWARLDADNAMVWLQAATDAKQRGDAAGVAEAMYRASHAHQADMHWATLTSFALRNLPSNTSGLARGALATELFNSEAASLMPHLAASQYCSADAVKDANRQQVCASVAEVLYGKGTSLMDVSIAAAIGQRVGWPAERVAAIRDERDAVMVLQSKRSQAARGPWSCVGIDQTVRLLTDIGQQGEMAVGRRALKASPENAATLAQRYREGAAKSAAAAASAASAVESAASEAVAVR